MGKGVSLKKKTKRNGWGGRASVARVSTRFGVLLGRMFREGVACVLFVSFCFVLTRDEKKHSKTDSKDVAQFRAKLEPTARIESPSFRIIAGAL